MVKGVSVNLADVAEHRGLGRWAGDFWEFGVFYFTFAEFVLEVGTRNAFDRKCGPGRSFELAGFDTKLPKVCS